MGVILLNKHKDWNFHLTFQLKGHMPRFVFVTWKEWVIIQQYVVEDFHFKSNEISQPRELQFMTIKAKHRIRICTWSLEV